MMDDRMKEKTCPNAKTRTRTDEDEDEQVEE